MLALKDNVSVPEEWELLFAASEQFFCSIGEGGAVLQANPAFSDSLAPGVIGSRFYEHVHPSDRGPFSETLTQAATQAGVYHLAGRFLGRDGSWHWHGWTCLRLPSQDRLFCFGRDISARKAAEQRVAATERLLASILNTSPAGVLALEALRDLSGEIVDFQCTLANRVAAEMITGRAEVDALVGKKILHDFIRHPVAAFFDMWASVIETQEPHESEHKWEERETVRWLDVAASPIRGGLAFTLSDITPQKTAQEELRRTLARETEISEMRSRFIAIMSHEFRTPLSVIRSSADLLELMGERITPQNCSEHAARIRTKVEQLCAMLDDLLEMRKLEASVPEAVCERLPLADLCQDVFDEFGASAGPSIPMKWVAVEPSPVVWADPRLVRIVVQNLLSNAIKYSPARTPVFMTLTASSEEAVITVVDHGIGIPEADQKKLFSFFFRAKNTSNIPGTGLGLNIVKRFVEMMSGRIDFESEVGKGSTFRVFLPICSTKAPESELCLQPFESSS